MNAGGMSEAVRLGLLVAGRSWSETSDCFRPPIRVPQILCFTYLDVSGIPLVEKLIACIGIALDAFVTFVDLPPFPEAIDFGLRLLLELGSPQGCAGAPAVVRPRRVPEACLEPGAHRRAKRVGGVAARGTSDSASAQSTGCVRSLMPPLGVFRH